MNAILYTKNNNFRNNYRRRLLKAEKEKFVNRLLNKSDNCEQIGLANDTTDSAIVEPAESEKVLDITK